MSLRPLSLTGRLISVAHRVGAFVLTAAAGLMLATPALAMTPSFDLDVARVGASNLAITVAFEPTPQGFNWAALEASGVLDHLVGVVSADEVDAEGRPIDASAVRLVSLQPVRVGVYGAVVAVEPGRTAVVPWPLVAQFWTSGTPATKYVTVGGTLPWAVIAAALIGLTSLFVWWRRWSRRPRWSVSIDGQPTKDVTVSS